MLVQPHSYVWNHVQQRSMFADVDVFHFLDYLHYHELLRKELYQDQQYEVEHDYIILKVG
jgi:hypothetical protein